MRIDVVIAELQREVSAINKAERKLIESRRYSNHRLHEITVARSREDRAVRRVLTTIINAIKKSEEP